MAEVQELIAKVSTLGVREARRELERFSEVYEKTGRTGSRSFEKFGRELASVGATMTRRVTLPLVGMGVASAAAFASFEGNMTKIASLVGVAGDEVEAMGDQVLELSGRTATAPTELSDALFAVTSAGARGAEAMGILEQSAKASATGMGSTRDVALAAVSAVNAYGAANLSGAEAIDILTKTTREGNFEASQLAGSIGNVLPVAQAAGVGLEEVGASVALLTRGGLGASEAVTQVRAAIQSLLAPSEEAKNRFSDFGVSVEQIQSMLAEQGLLATLRFLADSVDGNVDAMARMLGSTEALGAALTLTQGDAETVDAVFASLSDSAGVTDEAFAIASDTVGFEFREATANAQQSLIEMGDVVAPVASSVLGFASDAAGAFAGLHQSTQETLIVMAGAAAATGPMLSAIGNVTESVAKLNKALAGRGGLSGFLMGPWGLAIGAATIGVGLLVNEFREARRRAIDFQAEVDDMTDALRTSSGEIDTSADALANWLTEADDAPLNAYNDQLLDLGLSQETLTELLQGGRGAVDDYIDGLARERVVASLTEQGITDLAEQEAYLESAHGRGRVAAEERATGLKGLNDLLNETLDVQQEVARQEARDLAVQDDRTKAIYDAAVARQVQADGATNWVGVLNEVQRQTEFAAHGEQRWAEQSERAARATDATSEAMERVPHVPYTTAVDTLAESYSDEAASLDDVNRALREYDEMVFASLDADLNWQQALADTRDHIEDTAAGTDIATQAGRDNWRQAQDLISVGRDRIVQMREEGRSIDDITAAQADMEVQMRRVLREMGFSEDQANELLGVFLQMDRSFEADVRLNERLYARALHQAQLLAANLRGLTTQTFTASVQVSTVEVGGQTFTATGGGQLTARRAGGPQARGGPVDTSHWYTVGEEGPEIFVPDRNGQIIPNDRIREASPAMAGGGPNVYVTIHAGMGANGEELGRQIEHVLQQYAATRGPLRVPVAS